MKYIKTLVMILLLAFPLAVKPSSFSNNEQGNCSTHPYRWSCDKELRVLTEAIYFEARGEHWRGQEAIANVIINRTKSEYFPRTISAVVYQNSNRLYSCQFSYMCDGKSETIRNLQAWNESVESATRVYYNIVDDHTDGALFYNNPSISKSKAWFSTLKVTKKIGNHVFYTNA